MLDLKAAPLAYVSPGVNGLLQINHVVQFSNAWPSNLSFKAGQYYQVMNTNQVNIDLSYKIPANDFRPVDFSNNPGTFVENLYPNNPKTLYETLIGFKEGNYLTSFFIPAGNAYSRLEQPQMIPPISLPYPTSNLRYLGQKKPEDSPYDDKRIYFYSVYQMDALIAQVFTDTGIDYEKCVIGVLVNKCFMQLITPDVEQMKRSKLLRYYTEEIWL